MEETKRESKSINFQLNDVYVTKDEYRHLWVLIDSDEINDHYEFFNITKPSYLVFSSQDVQQCLEKLGTVDFQAVKAEKENRNDERGA